jgi:hypothetical protein
VPHPNADEKGATPVQRAVPVRRGPAAWYVRAGLLTVGLLLATVFGVAWWLNPYNPDGSPRTQATHTQLGMPPCNFLVLTGKPCPACGMTTSFALLVRGDVGAAARANWAGMTLAAAWAALMVWALASAAAGRPLGVPPGRGELYLTVAVGAFLVVMLGRWVAILIGG